MVLNTHKLLALLAFKEWVLLGVFLGIMSKVETQKNPKTANALVDSDFVDYFGIGTIFEVTSTTNLIKM